MTLRGLGAFAQFCVLILIMLAGPVCRGQIGPIGKGDNSGGTLFGGRSGGDHLLTITPYVSVLGTYDLTDSLPGSAVPVIHNYSSSGISGTAGVDGYHSWERTTLGITARGDYRHFFNNHLPDVNNEYISLGVQHMASRRTILSFTETAGSSTNAVSGALFGLGSMSVIPGLGSVDQNLASLPTNELFDNRVYFSSTSGQVMYQQSARLNFIVGGGGFVVRRKQSGAPGSGGFNGNTGVNYMLSRRQSIGVQYSYIKYDYTGNLGNANAHMAGLRYQVMLSRHWNFGVQGGAYRIDMTQPMRVPLDNDVAVLLGQRSALQMYRGAAYRGQGGAVLNGNMRRSAMTLSYARTISAGNNIFLTSQVDGVYGTYTYRLLRRCSLMAGGFYLHQTELSGNYKPLDQSGGQGSFFYQIFPSFYAVASIGARHTDLNGPSFRPTSLTASAGLGYSPTRGLPLW